VNAEPNIGQIAEGDDRRDAIHVAVVTATATEKLYPGQSVGADGTTKAPHVGIVDPFLSGPVFPGQRYWLCLKPKTVTSLRHVWTHPAFLDVDTPPGAAPSKSESESWLRSFADEIGLSYGALMDACLVYIESGNYHCFDHSTPEATYENRREMWRHYEAVTGTKVTDHEAVPFSCAC
jgi:hypothetical protein